MTLVSRRGDLVGAEDRRSVNGTDPAVELETVTVIVPTRNEASNVAPLVARVKAAMATTEWSWELVFADDSDDDTPDAVRAVAEAGEPVRLSWRSSRRRVAGLSGAVLGAFAAARGDVLVVIDGDLQHPPELLPELLAPFADGTADLVVATRYRGGDANSSGLANGYRRVVSRCGRRVVHVLVKRTRPVSDPLGGYFAVGRDVVERAALRPLGFKVPLEILVRGRSKATVEIPDQFSERVIGSSKADWREGIRFIRHFVRLGGSTLLAGRWCTR